MCLGCVLLVLILDQLEQDIVGQVPLETIRLATLCRARGRLLGSSALAQEEWIC